MPELSAGGMERGETTSSARTRQRAETRSTVSTPSGRTALRTTSWASATRSGAPSLRKAAPLRAGPPRGEVGEDLVARPGVEDVGGGQAALAGDADPVREVV